MTPFQAASEFTLRFELILQYHEFYPLRDAWLAEMASEPEGSSRFEWYDGRERLVVRTKFHTATLVISAHEWGTEYVVSFALGVAGGVVANVIYDLLKAQVPNYVDMLKKITPSKPGDIRIDIKISSPDGLVKIGTIERDRRFTYVSPTKLKKIIDQIDVKRGRRPKSNVLRKRTRK